MDLVGCMDATLPKQIVSLKIVKKSLLLVLQIQTIFPNHESDMNQFIIHHFCFYLH